MRRLGLTLSVVTVAATSGLIGVSAPPADAATCTTTAGVVVIVDNGSGIKQNCVAGDPSTGTAALTANNSAVRNPSGLFCRINSYPGTCPARPPFSAYWSYWHASASTGWAWAYSSLGGDSFNPAPGTVEGWAFGAGKAPRTAPPKPPAPAPKPAPAPAPAPPVQTAPKPAPAPAPGAGGGNATTPVEPTTEPPAGGTTPTAPTSSAAAGATTSAASTSAGSRSDGSASAGTTSAAATSSASSEATPSSTPGSIDAQPVSQESSGSGVWVLVAVVIAAAGGVTLFLAQRRRSRSSG